MDEYISKQRAKDLMGCCLASAKANYKAETSVFKKEQFKHYAETIEAMIDVVGAVEAADVQPIYYAENVQNEVLNYLFNKEREAESMPYGDKRQERIATIREIIRFVEDIDPRMDGEQNDN